MSDPDRPAVIGDLNVSEVRDGLIVYDPASDRVHHLNATASILFVSCDGTRDRGQLATDLQEAFGLDEPATAEVDEGLERFGREGLLA